MAHYSFLGFRGNDNVSQFTGFKIPTLFFFFSGARIDHGHHAGQAVRAVTDAVAMAKAVSRAVSLVDKGDDVTYIWVIAQV